MKVTLYDAGNIVRTEESNRALCTESEPAATADYPTVAIGAVCDDGNDDTMNDVCITSDTCAGEVQFASQVSFSIDFAVLFVPDTAAMSAEAAVTAVDASVVGIAVKAGLATSLGVATSAITITSIAAGPAPVSL